ncbi:hypothetical protein QEH52_19650 [Coraliomargarita sp. SDUM461003]|uniref:Uncharacterized protein n=1 Tax=Thalassobacterium maritimum TaxID=3041265 RepID=A0ABU1B024_9BACT|nr:hypothetical protein [Coraliomargarita sp. SDUM461003]MDQ8209743.1 hypothetical protein [Coraliomargarita sp. SDUM461003]
MRKIKIIGFAQVTDDDDNFISAPEILKKLDGIVYDDEFQTDYIGGSDAENTLEEKLYRSGNMYFHFQPGENYLRVESIFDLKEELTKEEIQLLVENTLGQWSDGMGENFTSESLTKYGYSIMCLDREDIQNESYPHIILE